MSVMRSTVANNTLLLVYVRLCWQRLSCTHRRTRSSANVIVIIELRLFAPVTVERTNEKCDVSIWILNSCRYRDSKKFS